MGEIKDKSLGLTILFNIILPGLGYLYMGRIVLGIFVILFFCGTVLASFISGFLFAPLFLVYLALCFSFNLIMLIHILAIQRKVDR